jgi:hypothetical protein
MSEMIDRVYKVLEEHFWRDDSEGSDCGQMLYIQTAARLVIEAMREPTAEMLFVGSNDEAGFTERNLLQSWHLMIDEALAAVTPANHTNKKST